MSTKTKPITPPKPDPSRLTSSHDIQRKKEDGGSNESCKNSTDQSKRGILLSPKPALYPKPQSPLKKPLEKVRPQVPQRPEYVASSANSNCQLSHSSKVLTRKSHLSLMMLKAPVAKLEEFDSLYEKSKEVPVSPVRPPRSPKIKAFLDGPFQEHDEKPELPMKKRMLSNLEKGDKDWDNIKKRSASLGRSEINPTSQGKINCLSLSRKLSLEDLTKSDIPLLQPKKASPIPPPRRRKKSDELLPNSMGFTSPNFPVYAQVNYEMKKNRRSAAGQEDATVAVVEGRLLLTGSTLQSNSSLQLMDNPDSDKIGLDEQTATKEVSDVSTCMSDLISGDKTDSRTSSNKETLITTSPLQQVTDNIIGDSTGSKEMKLPLVPQESELFRIINNGERNSSRSVDSTVDLHLDLRYTSDIHEDNSSSVITQVLPINSYLHGSKIENGDSQNIKTLNIDSSDVHGHTENSNVSTTILIASNHQENNVDNNSENQQDAELMLGYDHAMTECEVEEGLADATATVQLQELATIRSVEVENDSQIHSNTKASAAMSCEAIDPVTLLVDTSVITKDMNPSDLGVHPIAEISLNLCDSSRLISSSDVSDISDLVVAESQLQDQPKFKSKPKVSRRQSWSSSQETSPSPDHLAERKVKHRSGVPWCDEGDLSNGALADSDTGSSDNMARISTEDVNKRVNGGGFPVRSKIATWFDSFGKGAKKKERKLRTGSQNFPESDQPRVIQVMRPAPPIPTQQENREDQLHLPARVQRTSSGVSDILDNIPVADQDMDSDSDAEDLGDVSSQLTEEQTKERKVFYIAQELMTSERQFVDVLKLLNVDFVNVVNAAGTEQCPVIPPSELLKILQSLPQLQKLNEDLLRDLELRIRNWSSYPKIADVIVKTGPFLKLYASYIKNFEAQCKYLDDFCVKYPKFAKVVKEFEASPLCKKLGVKHYMLKPVQRIPQYRLLLEDYQRKLDANSIDYQDTEEALKIVRDVADHANETIKLGDHRSKMMELQSQLVDYEIIKPGRLYVKDGELFKLSRKVRHPRYFILLNDCLLYTSRQNTSLLRVNKELPLTGMKVLVPQGEDNLNEFNIISITRSFTLSASCAEERREWIEALEKAIKDHTSRKLTFQAMNLAPALLSEPLKLGHQAPVWIQDDRVTMCQSCTTQFTLTYRRHHCRACGKVVCGICWEYRAPLRFKNFQADRVCEDCYDAIFNEFNNPSYKEAVHYALLEAGFKNPDEDFETIKNSFKKLGTGSKKKLMQLKDIPQRLKEVAANDTGSKVSGWLQRKARRSWKPLWFVLKEQVLYVYKAQEDVVAHESIPILGYKVEAMAERHFEIYEGIDAKLVFQLSHPGQQPLVFHAKDQHTANRWIKAMEEATVLH